MASNTSSKNNDTIEGELKLNMSEEEYKKLSEENKLLEEKISADDIGPELTDITED